MLILANNLNYNLQNILIILDKLRSITAPQFN
jgi:hypothetical protein